MFPRPSPLHRRLVAIAVLASAFVPRAAAQDDRARVMGMVTDGSGGALPGVTVTVLGAAASPAPVVTDGSGRYLSAWIAPGRYNVAFALSGFETRTVTGVTLGAGQTIVLDQQLSLAPLSETVEVRAPAPVPPPPPPPPAPVKPARPLPKPVEPEVLASVCGPRLPPSFSLTVGRVVSHADNDRQLLGPGDVLRVDAGEEQGLAEGQNLVVRRRFFDNDSWRWQKLDAHGEQTAGLVQVLELERTSAVAMIVYACGEIMAGDSVERYVPQPAFFAVASGSPRFDEPAHVTFGEHGQHAASAGQMMVIDRGIMQGVQRGQRVTIFRRTAGPEAPPVTIGDGVVIALRADSSTVRIERTVDAVFVGDLVALHR